MGLHGRAESTKLLPRMHSTFMLFIQYCKFGEILFLQAFQRIFYCFSQSLFRDAAGIFFICYIYHVNG